MAGLDKPTPSPTEIKLHQKSRVLEIAFADGKHFKLPYEDMRIDFRAEFFNAFNHAQFFLAGGSSGMQDVNAGSSFGVVNGTVNNPRVVQLALKLIF